MLVYGDGQRLDLGVYRDLHVGHQFVSQGFLHLTTHLQKFAIHGGLDDGNELLEFLFGKFFCQHHTHRRRRKLDRLLLHQRHHLVGILFQISLNVFGHRLTFFGCHTGLQSDTGLLHHLQSRALGNHLPRLLDGRALQTQKLVNQRLFGRTVLGKGANIGQQQQGHKGFLHPRLQFITRVQPWRDCGTRWVPAFRYAQGQQA